MNPRSLLFQREPAWRAARTVHAPLTARSWLDETGSLTARLRRLAGERFGVRVLGQGFAKPFAGESDLLGLSACQRALAREVLLHGGGKPLVLARSIIPQETMRGEHCALARLGNRPLGEVLFAQRGLRRSRLEFAQVLPIDWRPSVAREFVLDVPVWGRRSLYELGQVSLLVCEFFLPAVLKL